MDVCQRFQFRLTMLFLYTGLALREYILRISGSDIRPCMVDIPSLCKDLPCFYKIGINARDSILELHWGFYFLGICRNTIAYDCLYWRCFGMAGLCKYGTDAYGEVKVLGKNEKKQTGFVVGRADPSR
ncbi:hypothetical protein TB2_029084 [Malus domestica]